MADQSITFLASFPTIQTAIKVAGDGSGMRIQLDIPETEMAEAIKLLLYRQCAIRVTVEPHEQEATTNTARTPKRTSAKRRI